MEEEKQAAPHGGVLRNATKVRALVYLDLIDLIYGRGATAREVAKGIGGNARSLYVLLERWDDWGLVARDLNTGPFRYSLGEEGLRYIGKLDKWFFPGYYSKKRRRRIPGYRGNTLKLMVEMAAAIGLVLCAYDLTRNELFYFKAPYHKASDFVREPIIDRQRKLWGPGVRAKGYATIVDAYKVLQEAFGSWCDPVGDALIAANIGLQWPKAKGGNEQ